MESTYGAAESGASIRDVLRALRMRGNLAETRDAGALSIVSGGPPLELIPADATPPRLEPAASIEGAALAAHTVGNGVVAFGAFLDGIQSSRTIMANASGVPIVHGTVAAVVRRRVDRILRTWDGAPRVLRALYAPHTLLGAAAIAWLRSAGLGVIDTADGDTAPVARHPMELLALARTAVQRRREELEIMLAERWCASEREPLFVDGGISGAGGAAHSALAIGVVKSHRTLYVAGESLAVVTQLRGGERTTAFEVRSPKRTAVASWYLRLRDAGGADPFFGLVRVEVARPSFTTDRADDVSRWILAERAPVSLPDKRWSTMAYGIRDCEEYLRALTG
jgi:hypothetical protein